MEPFAAYVHRWVPARSRLLEVGAGSGQLAAELGRQGHEVVAIDPDPAAGSDIQPVAIEDFAVHAGFDAVVARLSLHHVRDPERAVAPIAGCLKADGHLLLQEFCWDRLDEVTGRWLHAHQRRLGLDAPADFGAFIRQWRHDHARLAPCTRLRDRVNRAFEELDLTWIPYLAEEYADGDADVVREEEQLLRRGAISAVAFRYAGRRIHA